MTDRGTISEEILKSVIHFASAGARGATVNQPPCDWHEFLKCAIDHNVQSLVACALMEASDIECLDDIKKYFLDTLKHSAAVNLVRRQRVLSLLAEMQKAGFRIIVLKGYAISVYYAYPECRDSFDVDILIDCAQEKDIYRYLKAKGFSVTPRSKTSHHGVCRHKKYGVLEIHANLYDEIVKEVWFQRMSDQEYIKDELSDIEIDGCKLKTLGYTDQLIFLSLHMVKHFISNGLTIRMMLDLALFFIHNAKRIDTDRFWHTMEILQYSTLLNCILEIAVRYGGFTRSEFFGMKNVPTDLIDNLLKDIERGGYMGIKELEDRKDAGMEYNCRLLLKEKTYIQYLAYMVRWKVRSAATHMFPAREYLIKNYPFLKHYPVCIPLMRVYQSVAYPLCKLRSGILSRQIRTGKNSSSHAINERIKLFEDLKII